MSDETLTLTHNEGQAAPPRPALPALGLLVAMSADEPHRIGETILLPPGSPRLLGRGAARSADPHPRARIARLRPDGQTQTPPLRSPWLSRQQLLATRREGGVAVQNIGRAPMQVNGALQEHATLREGDVVALGERLVLLCTATLTPLPGVSIGHEFAAPDAHGLVGESPAIWQLRRQLQLLAPRRNHILILGQSGTGKELVARALHRGTGPLITRSAATFPEGLIDAELFGNAENFPQAGMPARPGLIGAADGGTLFLDEIAELPEAMQARLLRVLDHGEYHRLGESRSRRSTFRLIAATNREPGELKHDVLARFPVRVSVPPLSDRRGDIPLLLRHLLGQLAEGEGDIASRFLADGQPLLSPALVRVLLQAQYPDNVRGLHAALWRALLHTPEPPLLPAPEDLTVEAEGWRQHIGRSPGEIPPEALQSCLDAHNGNQEQAWQALGLASRHVLGRLIRKHSLIVRRSH